MNYGEQRLGTEAQSFAGAALFLRRLREGFHAVLTLTTPPFRAKALASLHLFLKESARFQDHMKIH